MLSSENSYDHELQGYLKYVQQKDGIDAVPAQK